jgi:hypothetical protein
MPPAQAGSSSPTAAQSSITACPGRREVGRPRTLDDHAVDAEVGVALAGLGAPFQGHGRRLAPDVDRDPQAGRVTADLLAAAPETDRALATASGISASKHSSSANRAASRQVTLGPLPATTIGMRGLHALRLLDGVPDVGVTTLVGGAARPEHAGGDLQVVISQTGVDMGRVAAELLFRMTD